MSKPFVKLIAVAAPLPRDNVDTDLIWPVGPGITLRRGAQAKNAFATLRYDENGGDRPDFILNQPPYNNAKILVSGRNFGCGSSREMAVWALYEWGFRCIIAPSFGDIFYNNAGLNGLLPVRLPEQAVQQLLDRVVDPALATLTIDLEQQCVQGHQFEARFEIDEHRRECLLKGLDETGFTLSLLPRVAAFGTEYALSYPWTIRAET